MEIMSEKYLNIVLDSKLIMHALYQNGQNDF